MTVRQEESSLRPSGLHARLRAVYDRQVIRFGIVSTISTAIDYGVMGMVLHCIPLRDTLWWHHLDLRKFSAVAAGYLVGILVNFVLARRMVFRPTRLSVSTELLLVTIIGLIGLGLTEAVTLYLAQHLSMNVYLAKTIAVVVVFFWNFGARRYGIYRTPHVPEKA